jgi:hypothetical protein
MAASEEGLADRLGQLSVSGDDKPSIGDRQLTLPYIDLLGYTDQKVVNTVKARVGDEA